jgi:hypothetical protein
MTKSNDFLAFSNREQKSTITVYEDWLLIAITIVCSAAGLAILAGLAYFGHRFLKRKKEKTIKHSGSEELQIMESNPIKEISRPRPSYLSVFWDWYEWNKSRFRFWIVYVLVLIAFAMWGYFENMHVVEPPYLAYAKLFGKSLDFLLVILIIPVLRNFLSYLRTTPAAELFPLVFILDTSNTNRMITLQFTVTPRI